MAKFIQRTILDNVQTAMYNANITADGRIIIPHIKGSFAWKHRYRDGSNVYQIGTVSVFGNGPILSAEWRERDNEQTIYLTNPSNAVRGTRSGDTIVGTTGAWILGAKGFMRVDPTEVFIAFGKIDNLKLSRIFDIASRATLASFTNRVDNVTDLRWSPNGTYLLIMPGGQLIKKTGASTFADLGDIAGLATYGDAAIAWHPDGDHFAVASNSGNAGLPPVSIYKKGAGDTFARLAAPFDDNPVGQYCTAVTYSNDGSHLIFGNSQGAADVRLYERRGSGDAYYRIAATAGLTQELVTKIEWASEAPRLIVTTPASPFWKLYDFLPGMDVTEVGYLMTGATVGKRNEYIRYAGSGYLMTGAIGIEAGRTMTVRETGYLMTGATALHRFETLNVAGRGYLGEMFVYGGPTAQIIADGDMLPMTANITLSATISGVIDETGYLMTSEIVATLKLTMTADEVGYLMTAAIQMARDTPPTPPPSSGGVPSFSGNGSTISVGGGAVFFYGRKGIEL